jgi:hypothetical protein
MQGNVGQPGQKKTACGGAVVNKVSGGGCEVQMRPVYGEGKRRRKREKKGRKVRGSQGQKVRRMKKEGNGRTLL